MQRHEIMSNSTDGKLDPTPTEDLSEDRVPEACVEGEIVELGPNLPKRKLRFAQFMVIYLMVNITFIIIYTSLSIGDYTAKINFDFLDIPFQTQFLLIGLVLIGLSLFIILYGVLYRHGRNVVLKSLFGKCKPPPTPHEYLLFNVIIKGFIVCILTTCAGFVIELIVLILSAISPSMAFLGLTPNQQILLLWVLLFTSVCLGLLGSFIWKNGYRYFIHRLIQINANVHSHALLNERRVKFTWAIYSIVFCALVVCIIGLYVIIVEGIFAGQGWNAFVSTPWELKIAWIGLCGMFITGFMILVMLINRRTIAWVQNALFIRPISKAKPGKGTSSTQLASISLFLGFFLVFVGAIMWVFTLVIEDIFGVEITAFLSTYSEGTAGYIIFMWGFIFFISTVIALIFIFFLNNGYSFLTRQVAKAEEKVETKIEGISFHKEKDSKRASQQTKPAAQTTTKHTQEPPKPSSLPPKPATQAVTKAPAQPPKPAAQAVTKAPAQPPKPVAQEIPPEQKTE